MGGVMHMAPTVMRIFGANPLLTSIAFSENTWSPAVII